MRIGEVCRYGKLKGAISIKALKRFVGDRETSERKRFSRILPPTGNKVAIVGSGPAGLTAGYYLAILGHSVTVFEASGKPGGMMRTGIPDYRLPKDILDAEIKEIQNIGVNIKLENMIESVDDLFKQGFQAVFLALGAHQGMKLGLEGEDHPGILDSIAFLKDINSGASVRIGDEVAVIGGGNAAIDSARAAVRLGARHVQIVYRRTRAEMPAEDEEIEAATAEGIDIQFLASPVKLENRHGKLSLTFQRMRLGKPDASGRRRPLPIKGKEFFRSFDTIIAATGSLPVVPSQFNLKANKNGTLLVNHDTLATGRRGVWAGGDVVTGPASVIEAIAAGRQAAVSIDKFLGGKGVIDEHLTEARKIVKRLESSDSDHLITRADMPRLTPGQRVNNFNEVELGLDEQAAVKESRRCFNCGAYGSCRNACPAGINIPLYAYLVSEKKYDDALAVIREKVPFPRVLGRVCSHPCEKACTGCGLCLPYCPLNVITMDEAAKTLTIDHEECVECGVCIRAAVCPVGAFIEDVHQWPRSVRATFSNPLTEHKETRVPGRGTEEAKTNEVTGHFRKGFVGVTVEMGRPGVGTRFSDVQKVAQALARAGVVFAPNNPVTRLITDQTTGNINPEVLGEKVLSAMIETTTPLENLPEVIDRIKKVQNEVDTVFSLTISSRLDDDGSAPCERALEQLGVPLYVNGKTNVGLGRPLFKEKETA